MLFQALPLEQLGAPVAITGYVLQLLLAAVDASALRLCPPAATTDAAPEAAAPARAGATHP